MKYNHIRLLEKHLNESSNPFPSFYFILGKGCQEMQEAVYLILKSLSSSTIDYIFDASQLDENQFWMEIESHSFFSQTQIFWIQQAEKLKKSFQEKLEEYFLNPSKFHYLIFSASDFAKHSSFYKLADEKGIILELPEVKPWEKEKKAIKWTSDQASMQRKTMAYPACQLFVKQIGVDYALLSQEMNKLLCYCEDKIDITIQDVQAICSLLHVDSIFQLGELIFKKESAAALHALHTLLNAGQPALSLLRQIRSQFQTAFQVALLLTQERPIQDITKEFPYMKGQILERQVQATKNYGLQSIQEGILLIDQTEYQLKNSVLDAYLLLELLIIKLT